MVDVGNAESDVMHAAGAVARARQMGLDRDMQLRAAVAHLENVHGRIVERVI